MDIVKIIVIFIDACLACGALKSIDKKCLSKIDEAATIIVTILLLANIACIF